VSRVEPIARWTSALAAAIALAVPTASPALAEALVVVRKSADAVDIVEPGSGATLMTVPVGHVPHEVAVSPDGKHALVTNYGTEQRPGHTVTVLDLEQPRVVAEIDLGRHTRPHGVAWYAPDRVAVTAEGSGELLLIDPSRRAVVTEIATEQATSHMVVVTRDPARAFVANIGSGSTTVIDLAAMRKLRDLDTGAESEGIAVSPDGAAVWVAARAAGRISIVDARTLDISARIDVPGVPIRIAFEDDGSAALVTCAGSSEVVAIDAASRSIVGRRRIDVPQSDAAKTRPYAQFARGGAMPVGLAIQGRSVYIAATMGDAIVQLALPSLETVRVIKVAGEPDGLGRTSLLPKYECHACEKPE
jgi:DNA-binding beta-propeller fold protein YncE